MDRFIDGAVMGTVVLMAVLLAPAAAARGDHGEGFDRVSFQTRVSERVANDRMQVVLAVQDRDAKPAVLAGRINRSMQWALEQARQAGVTARTANYTTMPVHPENHEPYWRGRQELMLQGGDFARLAGLVGRLQARLQVQSMGFSVSPASLHRAQDRLIGEAIDAFKKRAALLRRRLGADSYRLVHLNIRTSGGAPPRPLLRAESARGSGTPPALEPGASTVTVTAEGTVALQSR
ncbi:MAG TPA: SIMPL domain-containing protein [Gammaproteobacteria bacterium]|nr:SIMPL domain-containing protein [Gammaproteobacteria bacterium]